MKHDITQTDPQMERMDADFTFQFDCSPEVPCFTQCCSDVTIVLTPYDLLRIKNSLGMSSDDFLDQHTLILPKPNRLIPMVVLKMNEDDKKCSLVGPQGCRVYVDRPWACRMFPLDMNDDGSFRLITDSSRCKGLLQPKRWRIADWLVDQGVPMYDQMNTLFTEITAPLKAQSPDIDNPQILKMMFMALYNLDKFREFVFNSSLLQRFEVDPNRIQKMLRSDLELLKFSYDWIQFGIFGKKTLTVKEAATVTE